MANQGKNNTSFNFTEWLTQYKLTEIKQCFIDHSMNKIETLNMENDNFGELIQDQRITMKSHLIPNIIAAIESLKPIKTLSNGGKHAQSLDNAQKLDMYKQINSDKLDTINVKIDEMFNNLQKRLINKQNELKQLINNYKSEMNQNQNQNNNTKNDNKLEIFSFEINNLQNICDDLEISMKQFINTLNEKKLVSDDQNNNNNNDDEDSKEQTEQKQQHQQSSTSNHHQFDTNWKNKNMAITNNNRCVTMKGYYEGSIFLNNTISSGHHQYKFRIVQKAGYSMHIGLWRCSTDGTASEPPINTFFTNGMDQGYGYQITHGYKSRISDGKYRDKYGVIVDEGDIIMMDINFDEQSLIFYINNKSLGISHKIIKDDYRPAIYIYKYFNEAAIVEIVD